MVLTDNVKVLTVRCYGCSSHNPKDALAQADRFFAEVPHSVDPLFRDLLVGASPERHRRRCSILYVPELVIEGLDFRLAGPAANPVELPYKRSLGLDGCQRLE
jgi:hypothetical protein